ncbi:hypothetical protein PsYK624_130030 [Phanerochaete sordida]|uniref:Uncharacterized protein n=1 Tax=Phanerochaete sordida TaxID=48140 RepID=A0A9P3GKB0_9APHY|nr:hypothetical protein PsYK624_130030 [Phanerochaete sordida]
MNTPPAYRLRCRCPEVHPSPDCDQWTPVSGSNEMSLSCAQQTGPKVFREMAGTSMVRLRQTIARQFSPAGHGLPAAARSQSSAVTLVKAVTDQLLSK